MSCAMCRKGVRPDRFSVMVLLVGVLPIVAGAALVPGIVGTMMGLFAGFLLGVDYGRLYMRAHKLTPPEGCRWL